MIYLRYSFILENYLYPNLFVGLLVMIADGNVVFIATS